MKRALAVMSASVWLFLVTIAAQPTAAQPTNRRLYAR
jgi:hypothetical protein